MHLKYMQVNRLVFLTVLLVASFPISETWGNGDGKTLSIREAILKLKLVDNKEPYYWEDWLEKQPADSVVPILTRVMQEDSAFIIGILVKIGDSNQTIGTARKLAYKLLEYHHAAEYEEGVQQFISGLSLSQDVRKHCFSGLARTSEQLRHKAAQGMTSWIKASLNNSDVPQQNLIEGFRILGTIGSSENSTITFLRDLWSTVSTEEKLRSEAAYALLRIRGLDEFLADVETLKSDDLSLLFNVINNYGVTTNWEFLSNTKQWDAFVKFDSRLLEHEDYSVRLKSFDWIKSTVRNITIQYPPISKKTMNWWIETLKKNASQNSSSAIRSRAQNVLDSLDSELD